MIRGLCAINGVQFFYYANGKTFCHRAIGPGGSGLGQEMSFTYNDVRRETVQLNERGLSRNVARVGLISYLA